MGSDRVSGVECGNGQGLMASQMNTGLLSCDVVFNGPGVARSVSQF
jgi:hypothetical protein